FLPLFAIKAALLISITFMCYQRMFVTTIDVTLRDYHRFEIPSVPRFFDLRNPRVLKEYEKKKRKEKDIRTIGFGVGRDINDLVESIRRIRNRSERHRENVVKLAIDYDALSSHDPVRSARHNQA
ncbi:hypothetical protein V1478_017167, partial [Vespula squamosa]